MQGQTVCKSARRRLLKAVGLHMKGETSCPILVIGYGNPLRRDDGFGWWVAERLLQEPVDGVQVISCHQLTHELAEPLSRCSVAIFVDARQGEPAGQLEWEPVVAVPSATSSFSHSIAPADLLLVAQMLYGSCPTQAYLLTARGVHFEHGEGLSPEVEEAAREAVVQILRFVQSRV